MSCIRLPAQMTLPRFLPCAAALASLPLSSAVLAEPVAISHRVGVFSGLVVRGVQLSQPGRPVLMASADVYGTSGWSVGGDLSHLSGPDGRDATGISLRLGQAWALDDTWTLSVAARQDRYPDNASMQAWCYSQLGASVMRADQWSLSWNWRPRHAPGCHNTDISPNRALDFNARWPLGERIGLDAGIGRMSGGLAGYSYGQLGLYGQLGPVALYGGRTLAWDTRKAYLDHLGGRRWVASAVWKF